MAIHRAHYVAISPVRFNPDSTCPDIVIAGQNPARSQSIPGAPGVPFDDLPAAVGIRFAWSLFFIPAPAQSCPGICRLPAGEIPAGIVEFHLGAREKGLTHKVGRIDACRYRYSV